MSHVKKKDISSFPQILGPALFNAPLDPVLKMSLKGFSSDLHKAVTAVVKVGNLSP